MQYRLGSSTVILQLSKVYPDPPVYRVYKSDHTTPADGADLNMLLRDGRITDSLRGVILLFKGGSEMVIPVTNDGSSWKQHEPVDYEQLGRRGFQICSSEDDEDEDDE